MRYILLALLCLSLPVHAKEKDVPKRPAYENLQTAVKSISEDLDQDSKSHFGQIYATYSLINTVEIVRMDVENAVESCGTENPDLKAPMTKRYNEWVSAIAPVMEEANGKVDNMVKVQDYAPKSDFKNLFKAIDNAREEANSQIEKIPVTTEKACKHLLNKMDDTQEQLVGLLRQTLVSYPATKEDKK